MREISTFMHHKNISFASVRSLSLYSKGNKFDKHGYICIKCDAVDPKIEGVRFVNVIYVI